MLDVTRVESARIKLAEDRVPAADLIDAAVQHARREATREDVTIVVTAVGDTEVIVDPRLVRQAILNLVRNAVKFSSPNGAVQIAGSHDADGGYRIDVLDDGPGIPDDAIDRATVPFVQGEDARTREHGGLGIGLYLARSFLDLHDGALELTPRESGGTRATAWLPRRRLAAEAVPPDHNIAR